MDCPFKGCTLPPLVLIRVAVWILWLYINEITESSSYPLVKRDHFLLPLCLPQKMAPTSHSTVSLRPPQVLPRLFFPPLLLVVSGVPAAAMPARGSESPPNQSKDLT